MKIYIISILYLIGLTSYSDQLLELSKINRKMTHFYKNPSKEVFNEFQLNIEKNKELLQAMEGEKLTAFKLFLISEKYKLPIQTKTFQETVKAIKSKNSKLHKYIFTDTAVDSQKIDLWWTSFCITGDTNFLEKIYKFVGEGNQKKHIIGTTNGTASFTFIYQCYKHEILKQFIEDKLKNESQPYHKKLFLKNCLKSTKYRTNGSI